MEQHQRRLHGRARSCGLDGQLRAVVIDHVFTRQLRTTACEAWVDTTTDPSDHWPLVVTWPSGVAAGQSQRRDVAEVVGDLAQRD